jgi:hypothetical protein
MVVRHLDVMLGGPHERADHGLGEEEPGGVAGLDPGDAHVGCDADDSESVLGRCDSAGSVRPVAVVVHCGDLARHRDAADTVGARRVVYVGGEVRVRVVQTGIDVADQD